MADEVLHHLFQAQAANALTELKRFQSTLLRGINQLRQIHVAISSFEHRCFHIIDRSS